MNGKSLIYYAIGTNQGISYYVNEDCFALVIIIKIVCILALKFSNWLYKHECIFPLFYLSLCNTLYTESSSYFTNEDCFEYCIKVFKLAI